MDQPSIHVEDGNVSDVSRGDREVQKTRSEENRREEREAAFTRHGEVWEGDKRYDVARYDEARYREALKELSRLRTFLAALVVESPSKMLSIQRRTWHQYNIPRATLEFVENPADMTIGIVVKIEGEIVRPSTES